MVRCLFVWFLAVWHRRFYLECKSQEGVMILVIWDRGKYRVPCVLETMLPLLLRLNVINGRRGVESHGEGAAESISPCLVFWECQQSLRSTQSTYSHTWRESSNWQRGEMWEEFTLQFFIILHAVKRLLRVIQSVSHSRYNTESRACSVRSHEGFMHFDTHMAPLWSTHISPLG